jgi:hypothetical protein
MDRYWMLDVRFRAKNAHSHPTAGMQQYPASGPEQFATYLPHVMKTQSYASDCETFTHAPSMDRGNVVDIGI